MGAASSYDWNSNTMLDKLDLSFVMLDEQLKRINVEISSRIETEINYHYQQTRNHTVEVAQKVVEDIQL